MANRQDEPHHALRLAIGEGKMTLSGLFGVHILFHVINSLSTKLVQSRWSIFFFCVFMDLYSVLLHDHAKKLGQYPALLTSCLVSNRYVSPFRANYSSDTIIRRWVISSTNAVKASGAVSCPVIIPFTLTELASRTISTFINTSSLRLVIKRSYKNAI